MPLRTLVLALVALLWTSAASAHLTPNTTINLDLRDDRIEAQVLIPADQLGYALRRVLPDRMEPGTRATVAGYVGRHVGAASPDARPWRVRLDGLAFSGTGTARDVEARFTMMPPAGASARQVTLRYDAVIDRVANHVVLVFLRSDFAAGVLGGEPMLIGGLQEDQRTLSIDRGGGQAFAGFAAAVRLGMHHIAEGHDHLLFLLMLMLSAPLVAAGGRWQGCGDARYAGTRLLKVISAFTVGHSLTLIGGAFLDWRLPAQPVEVLIALSILISAVHVLRPLFPDRETLIAGGFGLVHGLAFAAIIGNFLFDPWHKAQAILGFNIGIELVQVAVAALAMPAILLAAQTPLFRPARQLAATAAIAASLVWIVNRSLGVLDGVAARVDDAFVIAPWLLAAATGSALIVAAGRLVQARTRPPASLAPDRAG